MCFKHVTKCMNLKWENYSLKEWVFLFDKYMLSIHSVMKTIIVQICICYMVLWNSKRRIYRYFSLWPQLICVRVRRQLKSIWNSKFSYRYFSLWPQLLCVRVRRQLKSIWNSKFSSFSLNNKSKKWVGTKCDLICGYRGFSGV